MKALGSLGPKLAKGILAPKPLEGEGSKTPLRSRGFWTLTPGDGGRKKASRVHRVQKGGMDCERWAVDRRQDYMGEPRANRGWGGAA